MDVAVFQSSEFEAHFSMSLTLSQCTVKYGQQLVKALKSHTCVCACLRV